MTSRTLPHPKWDEGSHKGEGDIFTANGPDVVVLAHCQGHGDITSFISHPSLPVAERRCKDKRERPTQPSPLCSAISIIKA